MNSAIQFLARLGSDAALQDTTTLATALAEANLSPEAMTLIQASDVEGLKCLMPVRHDIVCAMVPAEDEQESQESEENDTDVTQLVVNG